MTASTEDFLRTLYGNFETGWLTLFTIDPNTSNRNTDWWPVEHHRDLALAGVALAHRDVWFGVATRTEQLDEGRRGGREHCAHIPAMFADIDIAGPNHKDSTGLPRNIDEALELIDKFPLTPSIIVNSGGGLHPYWLCDEPMINDDASKLLERWAETWQQIATKMRLRVDNVFDLPRVLRLPGTINHKNGAHVEILTHRELRYGWSDFIDATVDPPQRQYRSQRTNMPVLGTRPGDIYNQRHTAGHVLALDGWKLADTDRQGNERWLHPWGPSSDCSATVYADDGHTTIWSETVPTHRPSITTRTPYDPFGLYVRLIHDGDFNAATKELIQNGYGERVDVTVVTMPNGKCRPKRKIRAGNRHLDDLTNDVVDGLLQLNQPPELFVHGDGVSRLERGSLVPVDRTSILHVIESSLQPIKTTKTGDEIPTRIDATALDLVLYRLCHDLPHITGVTRSPFLREDGTICTHIGWDEPSGMYLVDSPTIRVPTTPTTQDIADSVALIDEMIIDFPLAGPADRAHIYALLLTLVTRHLVPLAPLFALDGNGPGVGKNLLSECCAYVATGEWVQTDPLPLDGEEQRKQITAMLSTGRAVALFDEAHIISGVSIARLITSTTWGDRLLGYSRQVSYPNKMTVVALGNNVEVQGDMPRRTILIRLVSNLARPELREDFRHDNLRAWVEEHRPDLLTACLTIMRAWAVAGKPRGTARLGSFDAWAGMVGGALEHAGVDGFLANVDEMRDRGATDDTEMADHLAELHGWYGVAPFTTSEVADLLIARRFQTWPPKVGNDDKRMAAQLGYAYRRASNRWFGELMIRNVGMGHRKVAKWEIVERTDMPTADGEIPTTPVDHDSWYPNHSISVESALPQESGGDGGDGGDPSPYTREKKGEESNCAGDRNASPPSPPSPPDDVIPADWPEDAGDPL